MGAFSIWHWVILFTMTIFPIIFIVPLWRIITKAGYAGAWSLVSFVPVLNVVMLWVFAFSPWPGGRR